MTLTSLLKGTKPQALILLGISLLLIAFISGWNTAKKYYATSEVKTELKETNNTRTVITDVKNKDGSQKTITVIDSKTTTKAASTIKTPSKKEYYNVSYLIGRDFESAKPYYGFSINKQYLGPVTVGVWGLAHKDMILGVAIGFTF